MPETSRRRRMLVLVQRGLTALNALGSETALLQLNLLAQQGSQRWVREKAREMLNNLAQLAPAYPGPLDRTAAAELLAGAGQPTSARRDAPGCGRPG